MALADFFVTLLTFVAVYSLFGIGLNIKYGFTGLIDFGHVAYFMIGAYVAVALSLPADVGGTYEGIAVVGLPHLLGGLPLGGALGWVLAVVGGMVAAALVSLLVGIPTLRLREDYLAITALGIATILNSVVHNERWLFNGAFGIREVYRPFQAAFPVGFGSFWLNLVVFGVPSLLVLGYAGYRAARLIRPITARTAAVTTAAVVALAAGIVAFAATANGGGPAGSTVTAVGGLALLAVAGVLGARAVWADGGSTPAIVLGTVEIFVLWYIVQPLATSGVAEVVTNVLWLFAPAAGPAGGLDYNRFLLVLSAGILALAYWWAQRTVNSPYGRILRAIREDEEVPKALSKPTFRYKIQSLMFGSALAGAAGALWATKIGFVAPSQFAATVTFFAYTAVIIGGTANNRGVVLGTAIFWVINSGTRFLDDFFPSEYAVQLAAARLILIGGLLIVILYYRPEGILGEQEYEMDLPVAADGGTNE